MSKAIIKPVKMFSHPLSTKTFASEAAAERDYVKCQKEEEQHKRLTSLQKAREQDSNYVRLNAGKFEEIIPLMTDMCAKHGIILNFSYFPTPHNFGMVRTSHGAPIGKPTTWGMDSVGEKYALGWHGQISGTIRGKVKGRNGSIGITELISDYERNHLRMVGFHTGTGSGGSDFDIECYFFLEDFPKLHALYQRYQSFLAEQKEFDGILQSAADKAIAIADKTPTVLEELFLLAQTDNEIRGLQERIRSLNEVIVSARRRINAIQTEHINASKPKLVSQFSPEEVAAFSSFGGHRG